MREPWAPTYSATSAHLAPPSLQRRSSRVTRLSCGERRVPRMTSESNADRTTEAQPSNLLASLVVTASPASSFTRSREEKTSPRATTDTYVPVLLVAREVAFRRAADHRARFLLGFVDDRTAVYELLEATGMPPRDGVEALVALCEAGLVGLAPPELAARLA